MLNQTKKTEMFPFGNVARKKVKGVNNMAGNPLWSLVARGEVGEITEWDCIWILCKASTQMVMDMTGCMLVWNSHIHDHLHNHDVMGVWMVMYMNPVEASTHCTPMTPWMYEWLWVWENACLCDLHSHDFIGARMAMLCPYRRQVHGEKGQRNTAATAYPGPTMAKGPAGTPPFGFLNAKMHLERCARGPPTYSCIIGLVDLASQFDTV